VETASVTGHITASSIKTYISASTLTSISAGTGTISGPLSSASFYTGTITTTSDVTVGGALHVSGIESVSGAVAFTSDLNSSGNINAANVNVSGTTNSTGNVIAAGVIAGAYYWANGAPLVSSGGGGGGSFSAVSSNIVPTANITYNIGAPTFWFNNLYSNVAYHSGISVGALGIVPSSNAVVNIGSSTAWFANIYGTSTHALYADLAEKYQSDEDYASGTVVIFGESTEITISSQANDSKVAGVVSTNPAYLMNGGIVGVPVALQGRVPCQVTGVVKRGDLMVTSDIPGVAMTNNNPQIGTVIGKSLGTHSGDGVGIIEVVVGRV
jgi:hypothetical protein